MPKTKYIKFTHDNLKSCFNDAKSRHMKFQSRDDFLNAYNIVGCDNQYHKTKADRKKRGQLKQYALFQMSKLKKHGYDFESLIENMTNGGKSTPHKPMPKKKKSKGAKMVKIDRKESVNVLNECVELQLKKSKDYQSDESSVLQAMHYRRGVDTIHDIIIGKLMRATSLLEAGNNPNFESLEDTYKDMINYASFAVSYMRGKMDGQDPNRDMFNKVKK